MILKNVQMKNKQIAQRQWEWRVLPFFYGFYPEGQSLVDLTGRISASHLNMHLCRLVCFVIWGCKNVYVHFLRGDGRGLVCASEGRKGKRRDGWGQFGGPGCFNYPPLCRWVRARYLFLALSLSHDLSSTFIPKPSAPLAKQRKKGGQRRGFTAVTMPHLPLISLNLLFFLCSAEQSNLNKVTPVRPGGVWIWLLG